MSTSLALLSEAWEKSNRWLKLFSITAHGQHLGESHPSALTQRLKVSCRALSRGWIAQGVQGSRKQGKDKLADCTS